MNDLFSWGRTGRINCRTGAFMVLVMLVANEAKGHFRVLTSSRVPKTGAVGNFLYR